MALILMLCYRSDLRAIYIMLMRLCYIGVGGGTQRGNGPVKYRLQMVYDILQNYIHESAISGDHMECPIKIMQGVYSSSATLGKRS